VNILSSTYLLKLRKKLDTFHALLFVLLGIQSIGAMAQSTSSNNFSCAVLGRSGLEVKSGDKVLDVPIRLSFCDGIIALSDGISLCFINERRERHCKPLKKGEAVSRNLLSSPPAGGFAETVIAMARGDVQTMPGQSRSKATRVEGLPFGQILAYQGELLFDFTVDSRVQNASKLTITTDADKGDVLTEFTIKSPKLKIPITDLKPNSWYRWVVRGSTEEHNGRFLLVGASLDSARSELKRINSDDSLDPAIKNYLRADVLNEFGLVYERNQELSALKTQSVK
jgi:hypothetical protein